MTESRQSDILIQEYIEARDEGAIDRFSFTLTQAFENLHNCNGQIFNRIKTVEEHDISHPVFEALSYLRIWYQDRDYEKGAIPAKQALEQAANKSSNDEWWSVEFACRLQKARLVSDLSGFDPTEEYDRCFDFICPPDVLLSHPENWNPFGRINGVDCLRLFDLIIENRNLVDESVLLKALKIASFGAQRFRKNGTNHAERDWLSKGIKLTHPLDRDEDRLSLQIQKLDSYEWFASSQPTYGGKASILHTALNDCQDVLNADLQTKLSDRIQELEKKAVENNEYAKLEQEIPVEQVESYLDTFDQRFGREVDNISVQAAMWRSACWPEFFPQLDLFHERTPSIRDAFAQRITDTEHNPIHVTEGGSKNIDSTIPQEYKFGLQLMDQILQTCLLSAIEKYDIQADDFYGVIECLPGRSQDDISFLKNSTECYFNGNYAASFHLSMNRLEGVIENSLKRQGVITNAPKPDASIEQRSLSGLVDLVEKEDPLLAAYLTAKYVCKEGQNLRNRTAHSQVLYAEMTQSVAILTLYDVLRIGIRIKHSFE